MIISGTEFKNAEDNTKFAGAIFIDSKDDNYSVEDYISYGPNNEVYLDNNQIVAFNITVSDAIADVQIALKVANDNTVTFTINDKTYTTNSATDLYQSILAAAKENATGTVTIKNVSGGILSITNVKITRGTQSVEPASLFWVDNESASRVLMMMRPPVAEEPEVDDTTSTPETDDTTTSEPETSEPEDDTTSSEPEVEEPENSEPEEEKPESNKDKAEKELKKALEKAAKELEKVMKKAAKEAEKAAKKAQNALKKLFGR